jgi:hypothetical protein
MTSYQIKKTFREVFHCTNAWLGMRFEERELYGKAPSEVNIEHIKKLLEKEE